MITNLHPGVIEDDTLQTLKSATYGRCCTAGRQAVKHRHMNEPSMLECFRVSQG